MDSRIASNARPTFSTPAASHTSTAQLAREITSASSKQSYLTAQFLVDRGRVDDCCRAYAYLRWVDDVIDAPAPNHQALARRTRVAFIHRQRCLVQRLRCGERPDDLVPEEELLADLFENARWAARSGKADDEACEVGEGRIIGEGRKIGEGQLIHEAVPQGLWIFIHDFLEVLEFDAVRKGRRIGGTALDWYSAALGRSVTEGIQYFIGGDVYADCGELDEYRYLAANGAHITHMLRDMVDDLPEGFINIPAEVLEEAGIADERVPAIEDLHDDVLRFWVRERVELAREYFRRGERYIEMLPVLRCKIAATWYSARFEIILDAIEADDYRLRESYDEHRRPAAWLGMAKIALRLTGEHIGERLRYLRGLHRDLEPGQGGRCRRIEMNW